MAKLSRFWPVVAVGGVLALVVASGAWRALSWGWLSAHLVAWREAAAARPVAAVAIYAGVYVAAVAVSVPGSVWLTIAGGVLFGRLEGTMLAVLAGTCGAILLFLAARHALAPVLARRAAPFLARVGPGLERDGFAGLLAMRLIPVLPFWLCNLVPALVGMRLAPFAAATLLGIVPATFVFASLGAGLGDTLADGAAPDASALLSARVLLPLLGLATLALLPVIWRRWKAAHGAA